MMPVPANTIVWALAALLAVANLVAWQRPHVSQQRSPADTAAWTRWFARTPDERLALVRRYLSIRERPNALAILRNARRFANLTSAERDALRAVRTAWRDILARESPARRRELLRAPARAAAYFAYRSLSETQPERLDELAAALRAAGRQAIDVRDEGPSAPE